MCTVTQRWDVAEWGMRQAEENTLISRLSTTVIVVGCSARVSQSLREELEEGEISQEAQELRTRQRREPGGGWHAVGRLLNSGNVQATDPCL